MQKFHCDHRFLHGERDRVIVVRTLVRRVRQYACKILDVNIDFPWSIFFCVSMPNWLLIPPSLVLSSLPLSITSLTDLVPAVSLNSIFARSSSGRGTPWPRRNTARRSLLEVWGKGAHIYNSNFHDAYDDQIWSCALSLLQ